MICHKEAFLKNDEILKKQPQINIDERGLLIKESDDVNWIFDN